MMMPLGIPGALLPVFAHLLRPAFRCDGIRFHLQVKKLRAQLEQKTHKNGTENHSSPDGDILENGTDPNIVELQSRSPLTQKYHFLSLKKLNFLGHFPVT